MNQTTLTRIEQIEKELFLMEFKEHWTAKDWEERARLNKELQQLRDSI